MSQELTRNIEIFISYAHKDEKLKKELEKYLKVLKTQGHISVWHDRKIAPGKDIDREIDEYLGKAHIVILLVSPDFMASDYCYSIEVKKALQRHEANECRVIPIILRPALWKIAAFSKLLALPTDSKPVTEWKNRDRAFLNIINGIQMAVQEVLEILAKSEEIKKIPSISLLQKTITQKSTSISDVVKNLSVLENSSKVSILSKDLVDLAWGDIKKRIRQKSSPLAVYTGMCEIIGVEYSLEGPTVVIQATRAAHLKFMQEENRSKDIEWALSLEFNQPCFVRILPPPDTILTVAALPVISNTVNNTILTKELVSTAWENIRKHIREKSPVLAAYAGMTQIVGVEYPLDSPVPVVVIQTARESHLKFMQEDGRPKYIEWALSLEFNQPCLVHILPQPYIVSGLPTPPTISNVAGNKIITKEAVFAAWENIKKHIRRKNSLLATYAGMCEIVEVEYSLEGPIVVIQAAKEAHRKFIQEKDRSKDIEWALSLEFGVKCGIKLI